MESNKSRQKCINIFKFLKSSICLLTMKLWYSMCRFCFSSKFHKLAQWSISNSFAYITFCYLFHLYSSLCWYCGLRAMPPGRGVNYPYKRCLMTQCVVHTMTFLLVFIFGDILEIVFRWKCWINIDEGTVVGSEFSKLYWCSKLKQELFVLIRYILYKESIIIVKIFDSVIFMWFFTYLCALSASEFIYTIFTVMHACVCV